MGDFGNIVVTTVVYPALRITSNIYAKSLPSIKGILPNRMPSFWVISYSIQLTTLNIYQCIIGTLSQITNPTHLNRVANLDCTLILQIVNLSIFNRIQNWEWAICLLGSKIAAIPEEAIHKTVIPLLLASTWSA
jgi:hypothetical protein